MLRVTVLAANPDGSRRVVLRSAEKFGQNPERASLAQYDVFSDGHFKPIGRPNLMVDPINVFPLLPSAAAPSWKTPKDWRGEVTTYSEAPATQPADPNTFNFIGVMDGTIERIYEVTRKTTFHFDRRKGVITSTEGEYSQNYGFHETGTTRMTLEKDERLDAAQAAAMATAYRQLFDATAEYSRLVAQFEEEPANEKPLADARAALAAAARGTGAVTEVGREIDRRLKEHDDNLQETKADAKKAANLLNKPAPDWEAKDLDGKTWRLSELKGKVVVMDFWYRGCGWCMYAMPQVKQLAADYKDKPVVILGMNTDQKEEDAHFVVKELGLTYPQVKATGIPDKFGVQGFPTLIIVDPTGTIRAFDVGYSPDLREKVSKKIDAALQKPAT